PGSGVAVTVGVGVDVLVGPSVGVGVGVGVDVGTDPPIVTLTPADGFSRLPLSSTARLRSTADPAAPVDHPYDHVGVPDAGCPVGPPSPETPTPATTPPESAAVPETVTVVFAPTFPPDTGEEITDDGATVSVDALAGTRPPCRAAGCTPISASKLTVACCKFGSTRLLLASWLESSAHE